MTRITKQCTTLLVVISLLWLFPRAIVLAAEDHVKIHTVLEQVPEAEITWVKSEAEKAVEKIRGVLGVAQDQPIRIEIIDYKGLTRINPQGTIELRIREVKCREEWIVHAIAHVMSRHKDNKFFWEGIALYFQETYGRAYNPLFPSGEPLDDIIRRYRDMLVPIYRLAMDWGDAKNFATSEEFILAHMEAGSFIDYLVEINGEAKLRELHDSSSLNYKRVYGKDLKELCGEWERFVLEKRSTRLKKGLPRLGITFSKEKGQDGLRIDSTIRGNVGLIPGDHLIALEGETFGEDSTAREDACRIHRILSQKVWGESITLTVLHEGVKKEMTIVLQP